MTEEIISSKISKQFFRFASRIQYVFYWRGKERVIEKVDVRFVRRLLSQFWVRLILNLVFVL